MLLTLGAIILFGTMVLRINVSELDTGERVEDTKYSIMALALAKSRIDNAFALKFDAATVYGTVYPDAYGNPPSGVLTAANSLGANSGELSTGKFNDFDDYHRAVEVIDTIPSARFTVNSIVRYVDIENGFAPVQSTTWHKQIVVTVTSESMARPVVLQAINSYWKF